MEPATLETESYVPTDAFFGAPYIDSDEWRESPLPHRHVHGGFSGTDTRFTFYLPEASSYQGRMYCPLEGAHGGHDNSFGGPMGDMIGGLAMTVRLGGFMIESNQGHIGDDVDPKAGDDITVYGFRATNETARFAKHIAAQVYGAPPAHSYVWGGSGGGRRSPGCLEYGADVWDGALPFMGGGNVEPHGTTKRVKGAQVMSFASMFNVQRLLKDKIAGVVDAMAPGGSGNPFAGLDTHEAEELATLYRLGYPRGDEFMIAQPMGQIWLWSSMADTLLAQDPEYFENFWTKPGYVGHDAPQQVERDVIDYHGTVKRVLSARDFLENPEEFADEKYLLLKTMVTLLAGSSGMDLPVAVEIEGVGDGYRLGTGVRITSGAAAGRQLYAINIADDIFQCDGMAEANLQRFTGVQPGDSVHVDNRAFLAFCYYYRHHLMDDVQFDCLRVDGAPIYPQHRVPDQSPLMGVPYSGQFEGKLLWVHHTHDASLWPPQGIIYEGAVRAAQGEQALQEKFALRWTQNAEHIPAFVCPSDPKRATTTWLIDYMPLIEQGLVDLAAWCEKGTEPARTSYTYVDGRIVLPETAAARGGIQPVVSVTAGGAVRHETSAKVPVELVATAELPAGAGALTRIEWDFDGSGSYPVNQELDGTATTLRVAVEHTYDAPGTYFATARVTSHREGDVHAVARNVTNVASARIVVS